jgi:hypothetical protein
MIRDVHPGSPGSRGQKGTGSRIRNTGLGMGLMRRKIPSGKVVFGLAPPSPRSLHGLKVHLLTQPQHLRGYLPSLAVLLSSRH